MRSSLIAFMFSISIRLLISSRPAPVLILNHLRERPLTYALSILLAISPQASELKFSRILHVRGCDKGLVAAGCDAPSGATLSPDRQALAHLELLRSRQTNCLLTTGSKVFFSSTSFKIQFSKDSSAYICFKSRFSPSNSRESRISAASIPRYSAVPLS